MSVAKLRRVKATGSRILAAMQRGEPLPAEDLAFLDKHADVIQAEKKKRKIQEVVESSDHSDNGAPDDADFKELRDGAPKSRESPSQVYLLTIWNEEAPDTCDELREICEYIRCQAEVCPTTGKAHWQTVVVLKKRTKWRVMINKMKETFGRHVHVQPVSSANSGYAKARNYCGKKESRMFPDQEPNEWGVWPFDKKHGQGSRTDIAGALEYAVANPLATARKWIADGHGDAYLKYGRLQVVQQEAASSLEIPAPKCFWLWGPTGCGKSARAIAMAKLLCAKNPGWRWYERKIHQRDEWPGYSGQEVVIWQEFRECTPHQTLGQVLVMTDRGTPTPLNIKYSGTYLTAKVHIFTAPRPPEESFYQGVGSVQGAIDQMLRRLAGRIYEYKNPYIWDGPAEEDDGGADAAFAEVMDAMPDV